MSVISTFYQGFAVGKKAFFYYDKQNPVEEGVVYRIDHIGDNTIVCMSTSCGGFCFVPFCDLFKDKELCKAYADSAYASSSEHTRLVNQATVHGIQNPISDMYVSKLREFAVRAIW